MPGSNSAPRKEQPVLHSFETTQELTKALAHFIIIAQHEAIEKRDKFTVAISGGSLPKMLSELIGNPQVEWEKWQVTFRLSTPVFLIT